MKKQISQESTSEFLMACEICFYETTREFGNVGGVSIEGNVVLRIHFFEKQNLF